MKELIFFSILISLMKLTTCEFRKITITMAHQDSKTFKNQKLNEVMKFYQYHPKDLPELKKKLVNLIQETFDIGYEHLILKEWDVLDLIEHVSLDMIDRLFNFYQENVKEIGYQRIYSSIDEMASFIQNKNQQNTQSQSREQNKVKFYQQIYMYISNEFQNYEKNYIHYLKLMLLFNEKKFQQVFFQDKQNLKPSFEKSINELLLTIWNLVDQNDANFIIFYKMISQFCETLINQITLINPFKRYFEEVDIFMKDTLIDFNRFLLKARSDFPFFLIRNHNALTEEVALLELEKNEKYSQVNIYDILTNRYLRLINILFKYLDKCKIKIEGLNDTKIPLNEKQIQNQVFYSQIKLKNHFEPKLQEFKVDQQQIKQILNLQADYQTINNIKEQYQNNNLNQLMNKYVEEEQKIKSKLNSHVLIELMKNISVYIFDYIYQNALQQQNTVDYHKRACQFLQYKYQEIQLILYNDVLKKIKPYILKKFEFALNSLNNQSESQNWRMKLYFDQLLTKKYLTKDLQSINQKIDFYQASFFLKFECNIEQQLQKMNQYCLYFYYNLLSKLDDLIFPSLQIQKLIPFHFHFLLQSDHPLFLDNRDEYIEFLFDYTKSLLVTPELQQDIMDKTKFYFIFYEQMDNPSYNSEHKTYVQLNYSQIIMNILPMIHQLIDSQQKKEDSWKLWKQIVTDVKHKDSFYWSQNFQEQHEYFQTQYGFKAFQYLISIVDKYLQKNNLEKIHAENVSKEEVYKFYIDQFYKIKDFNKNWYEMFFEVGSDLGKQNLQNMKQTQLV